MSKPIHFHRTAVFLTVGVALLLIASDAEAATNEPCEVYVPDGQLQSHIVRAYIDRTLSWANEPRLKVWGAHAITTSTRDEGVPIAPLIIAPQQAYEKTSDEGRVGSTGTMLLFDLSRRELMQWYKGSARVFAVLEWNESGITNVAATPAPVNIGNIGITSSWMAVIVLLLVGAIAYLSHARQNSVLALFIGEDGHGSLSRVQLALWTVAVGFSIGVFGLIRAAVPDIPSSLVVLMGLSLLTGGVSYIAATKEGKPPPQVPEARRGFKLSDLICVYDAAGSCELSIAKAQMLFWTGVALLLFLVKTFLNGQLWDVPWELVTLTGMSQAAFVGPKFWKPEQKETRPDNLAAGQTGSQPRAFKPRADLGYRAGPDQGEPHQKPDPPSS